MSSKLTARGNHDPQSSRVCLFVITIREYMRSVIKLMTAAEQRATVRWICQDLDSGCSKFGITPGGGCANGILLKSKPGGKFSSDIFFAG